MARRRAGGVGTFLSGLVRGAKKWLLIIIAVLLVALWIGALKLTIAHQDTKIASWKRPSTMRPSISGGPRRSTSTRWRRSRARRFVTAERAAVTADRDRIADAAKKVKIIKKVYVEAQKCVGVPPLAALSLSGYRIIPNPPAVVREVVTVERQVPAGLLSCERDPAAPAADGDSRRSGNGCANSSTLAETAASSWHR